MFEKVSKYHPDKIADRIAGALVDIAYAETDFPKIAVEVLIGHGKCHIICETSASLDEDAVIDAAKRIAGDVKVDYVEVQQDEELAKNQESGVKCGDNGIFLGVPETEEEAALTSLAEVLDERFPSDGKYLIDDAAKELTICQSKAESTVIGAVLMEEMLDDYKSKINPLGYWTGGTDVDTGATNRKLGSDMGQSATGGGLHGKDLSKADVAVSIFCWLQAQSRQEAVEAICSIGDSTVRVNGVDIPYQSIVDYAKEYIDSVGGFERFAEYGLLN